MKLRVRALASTAPVTQKGHLDTTKSNTFNYQIANERAEAFIYFLTLKDPKSYTRENCKDALNNSLIWKIGECTSDSTWKGKGFTVTYNPWKVHKQMTDAKLVKDGSLDNRRRALEFLNRTVQIIVEEGGLLDQGGGQCYPIELNHWFFVSFEKVWLV